MKDWLLEFLPESVYYDRNIYDEKDRVQGQQMAFDIDPENVKCPIHGTLEDKMKRCQGLGFCEIELEMVKEETIRLYQELIETFCSIRIVYSGRGYHIHIFDEASFNWSLKKRERFAEKIANRGFPIDEWVTSGDMRLIRLPHSLHGMISRIVTPLDFSELKSFEPIRDPRCVPRFLGC
ncbi:MAG: hypothetical protein GWN31_17765 [Candidatus Thorarchaeota archaeon]|nr:hypothetical protein [Candidatus Thorarchaeota archaeon]